MSLFLAKMGQKIGTEPRVRWCPSEGPKNRVWIVWTETGKPSKCEVSNHLGTYTITSISRVAKNSIRLFVYVTIPPVFAEMALTMTRMNTDTWAGSVER